MKPFEQIARQTGRSQFMCGLRGAVICALFVASMTASVSEARAHSEETIVAPADRTEADMIVRDMLDSEEAEDRDDRYVGEAQSAEPAKSSATSIARPVPTRK